MGGAGIRRTTEWRSTISSVLVRHPQGDVLIDTGFGPDAEAQMGELPEPNRDFGRMILQGSKNRMPLVAALAHINEAPDQIKRIIITHAHYDHLGGATTLSAPIYLAAGEATWLAQQSAQPTIAPPSLTATLRSRFRLVDYASGPFLGFERSQDLYGDGTVVLVPLPGHTPGSQGVFIKLGGRYVFLIGDVSNLLEAATDGLPKNPVIRANTDTEPALADAQTTRVARFHQDHPDIAIVPAHDRDAFVAVFGAAPGCISEYAVK